MPDENRFAGLSQAVDEDDDDADEDGDAGESDPATDSNAAADSDSTTAAATENSSSPVDSPSNDAAAAESATAGTAIESAGTEASESEEATEESTDPTAFAFDETTKKTVYVRPDTLDDLEDARALVDARLRTEHDVRDLTGREFYDAAFRLAAADTDGLIDEILVAREE